MIDLKTLHGKSIHHRAALEASPLCGCFSCLRIFSPSEITEWVARDQDQTAVCPHCQTDSVLPSSEVELTTELLSVMRAEWFPPSTFGAETR